MSMDSVFSKIAKEIEFTFAGGGFASDWRQSGYRDSIFDAFLEAQKIETIHGDQMVARVRESHLKEASDEKIAVLRDVGRAWDEWLYAIRRTSKT